MKQIILYKTKYILYSSYSFRLRYTVAIFK